MSDKVLMKGNEAFGAAAVQGGCDLYFGYPITPQNELTEYMSRELGKAGGTFTQAESELAAINMAYGGAAAGKKVMISSSSPGIALMQEGFSFLASAELPLVAINVSRGGPGIGGIQPGQADYRQMTRGGGNGDYHLIVYAPSCIQEAVDLIIRAFLTAEQYRNPVIILADGMMGQMMEPVVMPQARHQDTRREIVDSKPWAITGSGGQRDRNVVRSLRLDPQELENHNIALNEKYLRMERELPEYETVGLDGAEIVFAAFGTVSRITAEAIRILASEGIKAGMIRPLTLWPFPYKAFDEIDASSAKLVVSAELSMGQLIEDVKLAVCGRFPVALIQRTGGMVFTPAELASRAKALLAERS